MIAPVGFPSGPVAPVSPLSPLGIVKLRVAALDVPELVTDALVPAAPVVVVPTATVAAVPAAPVSPRGIVKSKVAADEVPELLTEAEVPAAPVVVVPTETVAAEPAGPVLPVSPLSPRGIVKSNTAAEELPEFVTDALLPAAPVVVVPAATVAALPAGPVAPVAPTAPAGPTAPVSPLGIVKSKTAAVEVPEFVTEAFVPAAPVVVDPTATEVVL